MSVSNAAWRQARRVAVGVVGTTILLFGLILLLLPGPAFVVIPIGLAVLSTEFVWAKRLLRRVRDQGERLVGSVKKKSTVQEARDDRRAESSTGCQTVPD